MDLEIDRNPAERDVPIEDARRFFRQTAHAGHACQVCQSTNWEFPDVKLKDGKFYLGRSVQSLVGSKFSLSVVVLLCPNCGEIRNVATDIIKEWAAKHQAEAE